MFHLLVAFVVDICRKAFRVTVAAYVALNRWMAFLAHLTMMFFIWNFLLFVIGVVSTVQMVIGFGFDVIRVTSSKSTSSDSDLSPAVNANNDNVGGEKRRSAINEYWHNRRKGYQEMVDSLYIKYMNRLVGVQQQQQQYFAERQYFNRMDGLPQEGDPTQYLLGQQANAHMFMEGYPDSVNAVGKPEAFVADDYNAVLPSSTSSLSSSPSNSIPSEPYRSTVVESPIELRSDPTSQLPTTETVL